MFVPVVLPHLLAALEAEVKFSMEAADPDDDGEVSFAPGKPGKWCLSTGRRQVVQRQRLWPASGEDARESVCVLRVLYLLPLG